KCAGID
ncbi:helicase conserved C-terminal domain protein, partial [Vibrio parahaemolyticus AQ3810]